MSITCTHTVLPGDRRYSSCWTGNQTSLQDNLLSDMNEVENFLVPQNPRVLLVSSILRPMIFNVLKAVNSLGSQVF